MNKRPVHREYKEAVKLHRWLEVRGIEHFHVPNETGGNPARGAMNKRMGVSSGVPDFFIFHGKRMIAIELKRSDGGNGATDNQLEWLRKLASYGFEAYVCNGADEAIKVVEKAPENLICKKFSTDVTEADCPF